MSAESGLDPGDRAEVRAIATRLKAAVEKAGGNKQVATRSGIALRTLNGYLAAEADPKITKLSRLAAACHTTVEALLGEKSPPDQAGNGTLVDGDPLEGFIAIPRLEVRASAGPGRVAVPSDFDPAPQVAFRERWLRSLGVSRANAEFVVAQGDSMEPTINDGDLMLVDRGYGRVVNGRIYVLVVNGLVLVKRVHQLAIGGIMLISDNDRYPNDTIPPSETENLSVEGRVVWYGRSL